MTFHENAQNAYGIHERELQATCFARFTPHGGAS